MNYINNNDLQNNSMTSESRELETKQKENSSLSSNILNGIITTSLVAIVFGVPIFFTTLTMQGMIFDKYLYFYFWTLVATVAWATKSAISGKLMIKHTSLDIPIALLIVGVFTSMMLSPDRWHSFWGSFGDPSRGFVALLAFVIVFYLTISHFNIKRFYLMFGALLMASTIVAIWTFFGLLQIPFLPDAIAQHAPLSLIGSFNDLALFFSMMIPLFLVGIFGLFKETIVENKALRYSTGTFLSGALVIMIINLFSLLSYTPRIALAVGIAFFLIYILSRIVRPRSILTFLPMVVFIISIGFLLLNNTRSPLVRMNLPVEISPGYALSMDVAKASLSENFFFGTGPALYRHAFSINRPDYFNDSSLFTLRFQNGNGIVFDMISTIGIIGTILALLVFVTYIGMMIFLLSRDQDKNKIYSLGFVSSVVILSIAAIMSKINGIMAIIGVMVSSIGLAIVYHESDMSFKELYLSLKASPKFALSLAFISIVLIAGVGMAFFFTGKVMIADVLAGRAIHARNVDEDSIRNLLRARSLHNREGQYSTRLSQEYMVMANREALKEEDDRDLVKLRGYLSSALISAKQGILSAPTNITSVEIYAQILENQSYYDNSIIDSIDKVYEDAEKLEPTNPLFALKRGDVSLRRAMLIDPKDENARNELFLEAKKFFTIAIDRKKNFAPAYYQRSLIHQQLDEIDKAIDDMIKAFDITNRANANYAFNLAILYQKRDGENDAARAEILFRSILGVNDKEINTHFALAQLYEKKQKYNEAVSEYEIVRTLLPEDEKDAQERIDNMINAIRNRGANIEPQTFPQRDSTSENETTNNDDIQIENSDENVDVTITEDGGTEENKESN